MNAAISVRSTLSVKAESNETALAECLGARSRGTFDDTSSTTQMLCRHPEPEKLQ